MDGVAVQEPKEIKLKITADGWLICSMPLVVENGERLAFGALRQAEFEVRDFFKKLRTSNEPSFQMLRTLYQKAQPGDAS